MKKHSLKLLSLFVAVMMSLTVLCACDWITTNVDRNMAQVIAEVKISDEVENDKIYKRELNAAYLSYGYQYVTQYSYTTDQAYSTLLDNLITNRIIIQQSRISLATLYNRIIAETDESKLTAFEKEYKNSARANKTALDASSNTIENAALFLTELEYYEAYYNTRMSINDVIDNYVENNDKEEDKESESSSVTDRTTPSQEARTFDNETDMKDAVKGLPTEKEYEVANLVLELEDATLKTTYKNYYDLYLNTYKNFKIDISTSERRKAFNSALKYFKDNGFISESENYSFSNDTDEVLKYSYFQDILKANIETLLVGKYEDSLGDKVESQMTQNGVWEEYLKEYASQKALYSNSVESYESALESQSDTSFVLYNPFDGYGYVANILVGFNTTQSALLTDYLTDHTTDASKVYRQSLLNELVAFDQRESWVYNSYGKYDKTNKDFTFEETYSVTKNSLFDKFIGEVIVKDADGVTDEETDGVERTNWSFTNVVAEDIPFNTFFTNYVTPTTGMTFAAFDKTDATTVKKIDNYTENTFDAIQDLMYVFSTDPGCLGLSYGYLYSPFGTDYVKEFEEASKQVVNGGVGSYTTVATDYGYHIIVCTKVVSDPYAIDDAGKTAFINDLSNKESIAYKYRKAKLDSITSTEVSRIANQFVNEYKDDEAKVIRHESTYADLIPTNASSSSASNK